MNLNPKNAKHVFSTNALRSCAPIKNNFHQLWNGGIVVVCWEMMRRPQARVQKNFAIHSWKERRYYCDKKSHIFSFQIALVYRLFLQNCDWILLCNLTTRSEKIAVKKKLSQKIRHILLQIIRPYNIDHLSRSLLLKITYFYNIHKKKFYLW